MLSYSALHMQTLWGKTLDTKNPFLPAAVY